MRKHLLDQPGGVAERAQHQIGTLRSPVALAATDPGLDRLKAPLRVRVVAG